MRTHPPPSSRVASVSASSSCRVNYTLMVLSGQAVVV